MEPCVTSLTEAEGEGAVRASVCPLCLEETVKYTCPRCNTPYCSVRCYQSDKHRDCSETFYKDCFMEGLKDSNVDPSDKQKVMEMLVRAEADPDLGELDTPEDDLHQRLGDLDLDTDTKAVWARLTQQEQKEFEQMAGDGRLGNLVELWSPWWTGQPRVIEINDQSTGSPTESTESSTSTENQNKHSITTGLKPTIKSPIPNISQLLKSKPSVNVKYNVVNVLYAYAYICHLHNGDHRTMAAQSARDLLHISHVLSDGETCESTGDTIHACLNRLQARDLSCYSSQEFNISVVMDVVKLIGASSIDSPLENVLCALSDVYSLLKKAHSLAVKEFKLGKKSQSNTKLDKLFQEKGKMFSILKKCEFFLSWVQTYGMALVGLVPELDIVYSQLSCEMESVQKAKRELEAEWASKGKPQDRKLIQEL